MVDDSIFSESQGPVARQKGEQSRPAEWQRAVMENPPALEPLAHLMDRESQKGKRGPRGIQTAKPAAERGGIGHALGIFDRRRRCFQRTAFHEPMLTDERATELLSLDEALETLAQRTAFHEATPQRLAASDQAVVGVRERERRQEGEGLVARLATAAPHPNPIVILVMSLLGAAPVAHDRMAQTQGALSRDTPRLGPIDLEVVLRVLKVR